MISIVILTKNSQRTIEKTLSSVKSFDEVIILDNGSVDQTLEIARNYKNVVIKEHKFIGFGDLRNIGAKYAKNDWILALDSDEVLSDLLIDEINSLILNSENIYSFPFKNFYNNKHIKWCGWHPECHCRLYNRKKTSFCKSFVHEKILKKDLNIYMLKKPIYHYPYLCIDDFLIKMNKYSSLFADQNKEKKKTSFSKAIIHGLFAFFKSYIIKRGVFGGKEGFIISIYNANTSFFKYLKLDEINKICS
jgi:glycosyltransferase involved in cell wall biosynthesis